MRQDRTTVLAAAAADTATLLNTQILKPKYPQISDLVIATVVNRF